MSWQASYHSSYTKSHGLLAMCAHFRMPIDLMRFGSATNLRHASQAASMMSS